MSETTRRRIVRLEGRRRPASSAEIAAHARHERRMAGLRTFIDTAWPGRSECLAHYAALIVGLPHSRAVCDVLRGEDFEAVAAKHYGEAWQEMATATATEAARACEAAHGTEWRERFVEILDTD